MFRKAAKRITAIVLAGMMLTGAPLQNTASLTVSAGEVLGEGSFDYKIAPWQTYEARPARQNFSIDEGALHIQILISRGASGERYDLQTLYKNLHFKEKHKYKVSFKAKASRADLQLCSAIYGSPAEDEWLFVLDGDSGDMHMGPDMGGKWFSPVKLSTEYQSYEGVFTPTRDIDGAVWAFQYASGRDYAGNANDGDEIWFDDMSVECLTCDDCNADPNETYGLTDRSRSGLANNYISVNQLGYFPELAKHAVLSDNGGDTLYGASRIELSGSYTYEIVDTATGAVAYTGETGEAKDDNDSGDRICKIDFSDFEAPGEYYIRIRDEEWRSFPFKISSRIYSAEGNDLLTDAMNYFYQNRSGMDLSAEYITSGEPSGLIRAANRNESTGVVAEKWYTDRSVTAAELLTDGASRIDTKGGWCSGASFDKNMTEGAIAVWTLQNLYERSMLQGKGNKKFADKSGTVVIPESGNKYPDILDECRYELDFMAKMKVQPDDKTWGSLAGLYYHKLQGVGFDALEKDYSHEAHSVYLVQPPTFAATLNYAACAAQAARLWASYDSAYAEELLQAAKDAYQAYKWYYYEPDLQKTMHPNGYECVREDLNERSLYAPHSTVKNNNLYSDTEVSDDAYWAACELYISATELGGSTDPDAAYYLEELSAYPKAFKVPERITGGDNDEWDGTFTMFNWGNTAAAGSLSLTLHSFLVPAEDQNTLKKSVIATAIEYIDREADQGYGIPYVYDGVGYAEPTGLSYIVTRGYEPDSNAIVLNNLIVMAYAYDWTGEQKYLNGMISGMDYLLGNNPLAFSYISGYGLYSAANPVHRYWKNEIEPSLPKAPDGVAVSGPNGMLMDDYMLALGFKYSYDGSENLSQRYYADSAEAWSVNSASLSTNAALAWVVSFLQDTVPDTYQYGDVNGDGMVTGADAEMLLSYLLCSGDITYPWAADLNHDFRLDAVDLTLLKRMLLSK